MATPSPFDLVERSGSPGPLSGVRVLDLSSYIAGPYGCAMLADQGAAVIKIEPPDGDNLRKYPSTLQAESRAFIGVNRGKLGIALDLKQPAQHAVLLKLVREADVLVHNFRPSVPKRLGIDHERLNLVNPRLIYCALTGYGETGPMKDKAGYDQVLQTMTGMCALQGKRGGAPEIIYGSVVDYYAAALLAAGVSSALFERERSGLGQFVGVSLLRSALTMQSARDDLGRRRIARHRPRHAFRRRHRHPPGTRGPHLHLGQHAALLEGAVRKGRACATGRRPALRQRAQTRTAGRRDHPAIACRAGRTHRAGMGDIVRRRGAVRRRAPGRGHVRPSAGAGRRHRRPRSITRWWVVTAA